MSSEQDLNNQQKQHEQDEVEAAALERAINKIKNPPGMLNVLEDLPPEERRSNHAVVPQMSSDIEEIREDLKRD